MKSGPVPGCDAALDIAIGRRQHKITFAEYIIEGRIAAMAAQLKTWHGIRNGCEVARPRRRWCSCRADWLGAGHLAARRACTRGNECCCAHGDEQSRAPHCGALGEMRARIACARSCTAIA